MTKTFQITKRDYNRLAAVIESRRWTDSRHPRWLELLEQRLRNADIVESRDICDNTITLYNEVVLHDLDAGESAEYRMVLPEKANGLGGDVSSLALIGIAMLGHAEGECFQCETSGDPRRFRVEEVMAQPEVREFMGSGTPVRRTLLSWELARNLGRTENENDRSYNYE